jgi:hypothetical protein
MPSRAGPGRGPAPHAVPLSHPTADRRTSWALRRAPARAAPPIAAAEADRAGESSQLRLLQVRDRCFGCSFAAGSLRRSWSRPRWWSAARSGTSGFGGIAGERPHPALARRLPEDPVCDVVDRRQVKRWRARPGAVGRAFLARGQRARCWPSGELSPSAFTAAAQLVVTRAPPPTYPREALAVPSGGGTRVLTLTRPTGR